jgi:hypothetical protein
MAPMSRRVPTRADDSRAARAMQCRCGMNTRRWALLLGVPWIAVAACSSSSSPAPANEGDASSDAGADAPAVDGAPDAPGDASVDAPGDAPLRDAGPDALTDADVCAAPNVLRYESAGCGADARPVCGDVSQDACAADVCGCDGTTIVKCDYASAPWSHLGACSVDGGGDP